MVGRGPCLDEPLQKTHRCGQMTLDVSAGGVACSRPSMLACLVQFLQTAVTSEGGHTGDSLTVSR